VIDGDSVVVSSASVPKSAAVRYAWSQQIPWANLFNKDGLPAPPFAPMRGIGEVRASVTVTFYLS